MFLSVDHLSILQSPLINLTQDHRNSSVKQLKPQKPSHGTPRQSTDLEDFVIHLSLHRRNTFVISKLCHLLVAELEQTKPPGAPELLVHHKVELLLELFQSKVVWSGHLSTAGHLTQRQRSVGLQQGLQDHIHHLTFSSCMIETFFGSLGSRRDCVAQSAIFFMS